MSNLIAFADMLVAFTNSVFTPTQVNRLRWIVRKYDNANVAKACAEIAAIKVPQRKRRRKA